MNPISKTLVSCATLLSLLISSAQLAASSSTAQQSLKITIPKVALIKLDKTQHAFVFTKGTNTIQHTSNVAISSNDRNAELNINVDGLPKGFKLDMAANSAICPHTLLRAGADSTQFNCQVGMTRTKSGLLTLTGSRENPKALPDGNYIADITYTLTD